MQLVRTHAMTERRRLRRSVAIWQGLCAGLAVTMFVALTLEWRFMQYKLEDLTQQLNAANDEAARMNEFITTTLEELMLVRKELHELQGDQDTVPPKKEDRDF